MPTTSTARPLYATHCERCHRPIDVVIMSMFNTDILCLDCKEAEKRDPRYEEAGRAEAEAYRRGDFNFPGIGLRGDA